MGESARAESFDTIKTSHDLDGNSKKLSAYYAGWAQKYDDDVANEEYRGPSVMADLASFVAQGYLHRPVEKIAALGGQKSGLRQFFRTDPSNRGEERGDGSGRRADRRFFGWCLVHRPDRIARCIPGPAYDRRYPASFPGGCA